MLIFSLHYAQSTIILLLNGQRTDHNPNPNLKGFMQTYRIIKVWAKNKIEFVQGGLSLEEAKAKCWPRTPANASSETTKKGFRRWYLTFEME